MPDRCREPPGPLVSPPCEAGIADDLYMGFAPLAELRAACAALLQAERWAQRAATGDPARQAAAQACERLAAAVLSALGDDPGAIAVEGEPGPETWQAQQAALAVRLSGLLPQVRDDGLHALLCDLRRRHLANLAADGG